MTFQVSVLIVCAVGSIAFLALYEIPMATGALLTALVAWQALGGALLWRAFRPESRLLEQVGMGLSLGTALAALAGTFTATVGLGPWGALVPTLPVVILILLQRRRLRTELKQREGGTAHRPAIHVDWPLAIGFLASLVTGLAVLVYSLRQYPLAWDGSWSGYHPDMPFFEAMGYSLAEFGALQSPFIQDGLLRYHWLSYAWTGQLTVISGAEPFAALTRVLPVTALLGSAALVVSWTRRLSTMAWTPTLAGLLLTLGGFTGAVFGGVLTMDSPSQSMAVLWLIGFSFFVIHLITVPSVSRFQILLLSLFGFILVGGKVSAAAPALAAVVLMTLVLARLKIISWTRASVLLFSTLGGTLFGFLIFVAGASGGGGLTFGSLVDKASSQQGLNPLDGPRGVVLGTLILVLAVLPRWAGVAWLIIDKSWRRRPETWFSVGLIVSSILSLLVFNSFNEIWFSSTVSGPLAVTSAVGTGLAFSTVTGGRLTKPPIILMLLIVVAAGNFVVTARLWASGPSGGNLFTPTMRWLAPVAAIVLSIAMGALIARIAQTNWSLRGAIAVSLVLLVLTAVPGRLLGLGTDQVGSLVNGIRSEWFTTDNRERTQGIDTSMMIGWQRDHVEAAQVLRRMAKSDDLLATNLTLSPLVSALTHRRTYVSGILYQSPYGLHSLTPVLLDRERHTWTFIDSPTKDSVRPLCEAGVTWLWVDPDRTTSKRWLPYAEITYSNDHAVLLKLTSESCK